MSFQITILKVLAGHPEGQATLDELRHYVAFLMTSGADWTDRMKRLAARAPDLDVFSSSFVVRENAGWQITSAGREFLRLLEAAPAAAISEPKPPIDITPIAAPLTSPRIRFAGIRKRKHRRDRAALRHQRSVA